TVSEAAANAAEADEEEAGRLEVPISDLDLSVRANNCLDSAGIRSVGDLTSMTESDLLKIRSFGKTSLREIKRKLSEMGLSLASGGEPTDDMADDDEELGDEQEMMRE
ncbi:MAG: DNA-directed RNA polymerase subunit alpha C-terminal domain-containing protein, partial [Phycisphaeraceae bacterium]